VAVALLQPKSSSTESQQQEWSRGDYLKELNLAVAEFRSQAYGDVVHSMKALIRHYPQNHAAHILGDLAKIWNEKGQRYEGLDWKRAEDLSRELINVYPSTELVKGLGQDLSDWLSKEEPNMEAIQKALVLMEQSSWRSAVEAFGAVSEDSRFCELYAESRQEARSGWIGEIEEQLEDRVARQRWGDALEKLGLLLAIEKRAVWLEQRERYRQYFRTGKMLREAEDAHQRGDYDFVEQVLQVYPHDGPQGKRVQTLLQSAMVAKQRRERDDYFVQGRAAQAIEVSKQHFPEDLLYVQHVQRVLALYEGAQAAVLSEQPELVVPLCEKIMALESDETNHYVVQARRWRNKWSSSRQLADLFLNRANAAWENRDLAEALKWYQAAEAKGSLGAVDQLKSMEKQASLHYNRAMLFANQGDKPSVSLYLRKALALLPEGHRLRDRIELYVRRQMK
jgi:tetratricopeptide (TPR) repeat protein